jgi:hypothetical protein
MGVFSSGKLGQPPATESLDDAGRLGKLWGGQTKQQKSPGTESQSPPTGLPRLLRTAHLRSSQHASGYQRCAALCSRHRVVHSRSRPDGAPLCPVAYPSQVSFLVTATTGDGASSPVDLKFTAREDLCQVLCRFSFQDWQVLLTAHFCTRSRRTLSWAQPHVG